MKIALFLIDEKIGSDNPEVMPIIVLHVQGQLVAEVEKEIIVKKDINYLSLWLLTKKIKEIYVQDIDPIIKLLFEKLGVVVCRHEDIEKKPVLKRFLS